MEKLPSVKLDSRILLQCNRKGRLSCKENKDAYRKYMGYIAVKDEIDTS